MLPQYSHWSHFDIIPALVLVTQQASSCHNSHKDKTDVDVPKSFQWWRQSISGEILGGGCWLRDIIGISKMQS